MKARGSGVVKLLGPVAIALCAGGCRESSSNRESSGTVVAPRALAEATMWTPEGWRAHYDETTDAWSVTSTDGRTVVRVERADERYVASPDAYMNHLAPRWGKTKLVTILERQHVGKGFMVKLGVFAKKDDPAPLSAIFVVRRHGPLWYHCAVEGADDETVREQLVTLCESIRL